MIISRTPLRISLGGGGTDLPSYYQNNNGGFLVAAAINRHIYVAINGNFNERYFLQYSKVEDVENVGEIQHPLIRAALLENPIAGGVQITSEADIPAGTGLGSSGTFAVGLLKAIHAFKHEYRSNTQIADEACVLEIEKLGEPVGKQDQYIAAVGGLTAFEFRSGGGVDVIELRIESSVRRTFEENLLLFFTGFRRSASEELSALDVGASTGDKRIQSNLDSVKAAGYEAAEALESGNLQSYAKMLTSQWRLKFDRSPSEIHSKINSWIESGIEAGALGGKLVGAGGGGFLLFYAEDKLAVRNRMTEVGLKEVPLSFDNVGSVLIAS
jgi:D-glycero-alpha-D-manno-heptose-7-phosphate kinase